MVYTLSDLGLSSITLKSDLDSPYLPFLNKVSHMSPWSTTVVTPETGPPVVLQSWKGGCPRPSVVSIIGEYCA